MDQLKIIVDGEEMRCGYTTGSTATAASKAALIGLLTDEKIENVKIDTPAGIKLDLKVETIEIHPDYSIASVKKDAGDDPDLTDGIEIFAKVSFNNSDEINIDGGFGVGRITKKGLFGEIGEAAINPVPKEMIKKELKALTDKGLDILIYIPQGEEIGKKTFNSNIGIEGGISIIGSKGIVYPMSLKALMDTIYLEIDMIKENHGTENLILVPGNYGQTIASEIGLNIPIVQMSNYIGDTLKYAYSKDFKNFTLIGHIGKFAKLSIGIFNTHSKEADTRLEAFIYYMALNGINLEILKEINSYLTAEEAMERLIELGYEDIIYQMENGAEKRVKRYLKDEDIDVKVLIYSMKRGILNDNSSWDRTR